MPTYRGRTEDAESPILGADFWQKGVKIVGEVLRSFLTANGTCYELHLGSPVLIDGESWDRVSVGAMAGFRMALAAARLNELRPSDKLYLECTGKTETKKGNPRVNFSLEVSRG